MNVVEKKIVAMDKITQNCGDLGEDNLLSDISINFSEEKSSQVKKYRKKIFKNSLLVLKSIIEENAKSTPYSIQNKYENIEKMFNFTEKNPQLMSFVDCVYSIKMILNPEISTLVLTLIYIDRVSQSQEKQIMINNNNVYKLFVIAFFIASKYNEDFHVPIKILSHVSKLPFVELFELENLFFKLIKFNLYINEETYNIYYKYLLKY